MAKKKVSAELRKRLLGHKSTSGGILIDNKTMTKITVRALPRPQVLEGEDPCVLYRSIYSNALNKGVTSPRSFGMKCPILDYLDDLRITGSKSEKEAGFNAAKGQREFWLPVVIKGDLGDAASPKVRVLRMKVQPHDQLLDHMTAEEGQVDDITDPDDGAYFIYERKVEDSNTEYRIIKVLESCPIVPETYTDDDRDELQAKFVEMAADFDVSGFFYSVDWDKLAEVYMALSGEALPEEYLEQPGGPNSDEPAPGQVVEEPEASEEPEELETEGATPASDTLSVLIDGEAQEVELGVTMVSGKLTEDEEAEVIGTVMAIGEPDDDGDVPVDIKLEDGAWTTVYPAAGTPLSLVEPEEPEETEPTKAPKKPKPKAPKKPAATSKKAAPKKAASKKAVGKKLVKGKASSKLRSKLSKRKKSK